MSDIEEVPLDDIVPVVPVVEISTNQHRSSHRSRSPAHRRPSSRSRRSPVYSDRGDYSDELTDSEEDDDDDDDDDDDGEHMPSGRHHDRHRGSHEIKTVNGKLRIDMTPPDLKLKEKEKRANKLAANGKADRAIQEYIRCMALARIVYGSSHWRFAESMVNLAEAYFDLKDYYLQAEYHSENAKDVMLHGVSTSASQQEKSDIYLVLIRVFYTLGRADSALKKYSEAEQAFTKAERILKEWSRLPHVRVEDKEDFEIKLFLAMARLYSRQKKYALASTQYDKVIDLMEKVYGQDSLHLIPVYHDYGALEQSKGRHANHEKAIELFLQAHSIASCHHREGSVKLVETALALARAYASTGREEAEGSAESYLNECLGNCTAVYGPHHAKTLEVNDELARLLIRTNRYEEAMTILKSSINPKSEVFGDYSEQVSDTYKLMASIHLSTGEIEKALRSYKKCHTIETLVLGKKHKKTMDSQRTLEMLMASPCVSNKFVLSKEDELQKRPRFSSVVKQS
ncbi:tetratricopeptide repeat protein 23-like [Gigantopelta aegis]|uniref:tetratricopeptide repeat protein 23-like n=1 Tax=Gigantopelta aegis TaxID=1735272 RepID=UPI001B88D35B|nr:tetratricopeptide repeat protein 23-like [Gigantopelta aegis]